MDVREWAGTTTTRYDLHRFTSNGHARCNPEIRTYSQNMTPEIDRHRHPYTLLRAREEIEAEVREWAGRLEYRFCSDCTAITENEEN